MLKEKRKKVVLKDGMFLVRGSVTGYLKGKFEKDGHIKLLFLGKRLCYMGIGSEMFCKTWSKKKKKKKDWFLLKSVYNCFVRWPERLLKIDYRHGESEIRSNHVKGSKEIACLCVTLTPCGVNQSCV